MSLKKLHLGSLLDEWLGDHGGFPHFDQIDVRDFKTALLAGMDLKRAEINILTSQKDKPTFENTIAVLEDIGRPYSRAMSLFEIYAMTMNDQLMQTIATEVRPLMANFEDELVQNDALFQRIKTVFTSPQKSFLSSEEVRVVETYYSLFTRRGAAVDKNSKARIKEINELLSNHFEQFKNHVQADQEKYLILQNATDLEGLPHSLQESAASEAAKLVTKDPSLSGKWVITNTRASIDPFLTFSARRDLREKVWRMWINRGNNDDANDNKSVISEILRLRAERARLLGFSTFAHWVINDTMAKTPEIALNLIMSIWKAAVRRVLEEVADMQGMADAEKQKITIEAWDYRYYAEKIRKAKYDIDESEVSEYLQLDKLREGMFWAAKQVFGVEMIEINGLPVVHPEVSVYEVHRNGTQIGLWYFDPFVRSGKRAGAWCFEYRTQENFHKKITSIVSNNSNFVRGEAGAPTLLSWVDVVTMFHEFGHALNAVLSNVKYPLVAGTNTTKRDFVEFPSQVNERWVLTEELLRKYALHFQTGKPIPEELIEKIKKARTFNSGFATVEQLASAIFDLRVHLAATPESLIDPDHFEQMLMAEIGCPKEVGMRHKPTQFLHAFESDNYASAYYSYIWSDTLAADASEAFKEAGSFYDRKTCDRFHDTVFSVGNSVAPDQAFRNFRGRDVDTNALLRDRGFPTP